MNRPVGIVGIAVELPSRRLTLAELLDGARPSPSDRKLLEAFGIESVAVSSRTAYRLALDAARSVLHRAELDPADVDAIIHIPSRVPESLMSSESARLQYELGASRALVLGCGDLGCTSSSAALLLARTLLQTHRDWRNVLVTHGSTAVTESRLRLPVTLNGDAGLAILVGTKRYRMSVEAGQVRTDGRYWDLFSVEYLERTRASWVERCADPQRYSFQLAVDSRNVLAAMVRELVPAGVGLADVRAVMQNISTGAFAFYEQALGVSFESVCRLNLRHLGHLGAVDVFANLAPLMDDLVSGELVMVLNNSPAAAWSTILLRTVGER